MDESNGQIWRASSYSGGTGNCVEVALKSPQLVATRDSKGNLESLLMFRGPVWQVFVGRIKDGEMDSNKV